MSAVSPRLLLLAAAPAVTAVTAGLMLVALNAGGAVSVGPLRLMSLAAGYARPAERLLATPAPSVPEAERAERLTRQALAEFPYDAAGWMRLAYAETLQAGQVTPEAVAALRRSYELSSADYYAGVWRIGFILENSQAIPRDLRIKAREEFELLWRIYRRRAALTQLPTVIRNPAGRLSAGLWLSRAKASAAK